MSTREVTWEESWWPKSTTGCWLLYSNWLRNPVPAHLSDHLGQWCSWAKQSRLRTRNRLHWKMRFSFNPPLDTSYCGERTGFRLTVFSWHVTVWTRLSNEIQMTKRKFSACREKPGQLEVIGIRDFWNFSIFQWQINLDNIGYDLRSKWFVGWAPNNTAVRKVMERLASGRTFRLQQLIQIRDRRIKE